MSWSLNAFGKPKAVLTKIDDDSKRISVMSEPEQTIKDRIVDTVKMIVASLPDNVAVKVEASGSQSGQYNPETKSHDLNLINSARFSVEPIWGFVE